MVDEKSVIRPTRCAKTNVAYGNAVIGDTAFATRRISTSISIASTTIRANMDIYST